MKMKSIHTSSKALTVWCIDLTSFHEDKEYSHKSKSFNHVRSWLDLLWWRKGLWSLVSLIWFEWRKGFWSIASLINLNFFERTSSIFARSSVFLFLLFFSSVSYVFVFSCLLYLCLNWWFYCLFINKSCAIYLKSPSCKGYFRKFDMKIT
jgi:hypothetical protein